MLAFMTAPREDPRERPIAASARSESGPNPESAGSQESESDPKAVAEQRIPVPAPSLASRPASRQTLVRLLSRVSEDPVEVDAAITEIGELSGERVYLYIKSLEFVISTRLDAQAGRLDALSGKVDKRGEQLDALSGKVDTLSAKVDKHGEQIGELSAKVDKHGEQIGELSAKVDKHGEQLDALSGKVDTLSGKVDRQGEQLHALSAKVDKHGEQIESLRRENHIILAVVTLIAALGIIDWLPLSCSRPAQSNVGAEAAQTSTEPSADEPGSPAVRGAPSAEPLEPEETEGTDGNAETDGGGSAADPDVGSLLQESTQRRRWSPLDADSAPTWAVALSGARLPQFRGLSTADTVSSGYSSALGNKLVGAGCPQTISAVPAWVLSACANTASHGVRCRAGPDSESQSLAVAALRPRHETIGHPASTSRKGCRCAVARHRSNRAGGWPGRGPFGLSFLQREATLNEGFDTNEKVEHVLRHSLPRACNHPISASRSAATLQAPFRIGTHRSLQLHPVRGRTRLSVYADIAPSFIVRSADRS